MNSWPQLREIFTQKFAEKTQREWEDIFDGTDSCVTPIVPLSAKDTRPIARFSDSPGLDISDVKVRLLKPGEGGANVLQDWMGWVENRDYVIGEQGIVVKKVQARL
jgi:alpha-methylacyl-CoA racemase